MNTINDTRELKTPSGEHTIIARAYFTGEDRRENRRMILKLNDEGKTAKVEGIEEAENFLIGKVILEIDGTKDNIVQRVLKMQVEDYDFIIETVNEVSQGMPKKKEKISDGSTESTSTDQK